MSAVANRCLQELEITTAPTIHTVLYGLHTKGSLSASNLTVWATDGQCRV
jgi:hypothetical protein